MQIFINYHYKIHNRQTYKKNPVILLTQKYIHIFFFKKNYVN